MGKREIESIPLKYCKIDFEKRVELIQAVLFDKESIIKASKRLEIKFSTAKLIIKRYKESGYIFQRKEDQEVRTQAKRSMVADFDIKKQEQELIASNAASDFCKINTRPSQGLECPQFPLISYFYFGPLAQCAPYFGPFF